MTMKATWIIQVVNEEQPRAVRAKTGHRARLWVMDRIIGEARKATVDDAWRLAEQGVKIEEAGDEE